MTNSQRLAIVRRFFSLWLTHHEHDQCPASAGEDSQSYGPETSPEAAVWQHESSDSEPNTDSPAADPITSESILIRDGFYCGRKFRSDRYDAVWFMEEDELKIHAHTGEVAAVFVGEEIGDASLLEIATESVTDPTPQSTPIAPLAADRQMIVRMPEPGDSSAAREAAKSDANDETSTDKKAA